MATWQQVRKGKLARRRALLPLGAQPLPLPTVGPDGKLSAPNVGDDTAPLDLRILTSGELGEVLARAQADARAKDAEPREGDPIYDLARMEHTLLLCCIDPDSPDEAPRLFFASIEEIRKSPDLGQDKLAYLYELQQRFQAECSPKHDKLGLEDILAGMLVLGGEDEESAARFFVSLGPDFQWSFTRSMACQWRISLTGKSPSGSPTAASSTDSSTSTPSAPPPAPREPEPTPARPTKRKPRQAKRKPRRSRR